MSIGLSEIDHFPLLTELLHDDKDFFQDWLDLRWGDGEVIDEQDLLALGLGACQSVGHLRSCLLEAAAPPQRRHPLQLLLQTLTGETGGEFQRLGLVDLDIVGLHETVCHPLGAIACGAPQDGESDAKDTEDSAPHAMTLCSHNAPMAHRGPVRYDPARPVAVSMLVISFYHTPRESTTALQVRVCPTPACHFSKHYVTKAPISPMATIIDPLWGT
jgi:hypothetical protein